MKNVKLLLTAVLLAVGMSASAQFTSASGSKGYGGASGKKGQFALGANFSYTPSLESGVSLNHFGLSAKLQYGFTDAIRGELLVGYDFKNKEIGIVHASGNFHYLFNVADKLIIYPIAGVGYAHVDAGIWDDLYHALKDTYYEHYDDDDVDEPTRDYLIVNAGLGAEYAITDHVSGTFEVKYQYMKDNNRLPISLGLIYKF